MSITTRISLGVVFLTKALSANSSAKCIIHAEYLVKTKQYLLTKIKYSHTVNMTLGVKSSETYCANITDVLHRLSKVVTRKIEDGYAFDSSAMQLMEEADETWGDFELAGTSVDPLLDIDESPEEILETVLHAYGAQRRLRGTVITSLPRNRKTAPVIAGRIKHILSQKAAADQRMWLR